jgi:hypothetical protein
MYIEYHARGDIWVPVDPISCETPQKVHHRQARHLILRLLQKTEFL